MNDIVTWDVCESPIGPLTLIGGEAGLRGLWFPGKTPVGAESARAPMPAGWLQPEEGRSRPSRV